MNKIFQHRKSFLQIAPAFLLYLAIRLPGLGSDILNSDGARWYRRSSNFLSAIRNGNFIETYQHYQPGVTLMWIRAGVENLTSSIQSAIGSHQWFLENYAYFVRIHTFTKAALVFILLLLAIYQVVIVKKLFGMKAAVIFGLLIAVEPYLAGIDRWFHLTSLEVYLSFSAFLTAVYWAKRRGDYKLLVLSGVFMALSALSKITGIITFLPVLSIICLEYWKDSKRTTKKFYLRKSWFY